MNMLMWLAAIGVFFLLIAIAVIVSAARVRGRRAPDKVGQDKPAPPRPDTRESMRPGDK